MGPPGFVLSLGPVDPSPQIVLATQEKISRWTLAITNSAASAEVGSPLN